MDVFGFEGDSSGLFPMLPHFALHRLVHHSVSCCWIESTTLHHLLEPTSRRNLYTSHRLARQRFLGSSCSTRQFNCLASYLDQAPAKSHIRSRDKQATKDRTTLAWSSSIKITETPENKTSIRWVMDFRRGNQSWPSVVSFDEGTRGTKKSTRPPPRQAIRMQEKAGSNAGFCSAGA